MELKEILDERIIDLNLVAKNKEDAIFQLAKKLKDGGYVSDIDKFIEDIYLREKQGETGIGNFVAIPHGKSDSVTKIGIAIGKLEQEVEWETIDGKGVKLILLFAVSNDHQYARNHMILLSQIARKLGDDQSLEKLLSAKTMNDLIQIFS